MNTTLTIDHGHTNPHLGLFKGDELVDIVRLESFLAENSGLLADSQVVVSNVTNINPLASIETGKLIEVSKLREEKRFLDMPVNYSSQLGEDRLVQAYYVFKEWIQKRAPKRILLVDAGTFTTVDLITKEGFEGGYILPGLQTFLNCYGGGDHLPILESSSIGSIKRGLPKNTEEAVGQAASFYVKSVLKEIKKQTNPDLIIVTGGQGEAFLSQNIKPFQWEPQLIHRALYAVSKEAH